MRKRTNTSGARRRLGGNPAAPERIDEYAPGKYASTNDYAGAQAFSAERYNDRDIPRHREHFPSAVDAVGEFARQHVPASKPADIPAPAAAAGDYNAARYTASGKRRRRKRGIIAAVAVAVALVAFIAIGGLNGILHNGLDASLWGVLDKVGKGEPFYMLLVGTDESADRQDDPEMAGVFRTDTMILARVDPGKQTASLVSIPRDTQVDLGEYGTQKINAAYAFGGPTLAVQAVEDLAGVGISHYAEIDFDGFVGLVDALGGVEVDVPMTIDDEDAGGHVDAGYQTLDSWQALILCRSRNAYEEVVGQGDLYRTANQRLVLGAIVKKILASDPATQATSIASCSQYVRTDLDLADIVDLAGRFQGFDADTQMFSAIFPTTPEYSDDLWWDIADLDAWVPMRERMDAGLSPAEADEVDPTTGTVLAHAGNG